MVKQSFTLDPNAQAYTDDEIVGKVNTATVNISRTDAVTSAAVDLSGKDSDDLSEGTGNKYDTGAPPADLDALADGSTYKKMLATEQTKLGTIEDSATSDQSAQEVHDLIVGMAEANRAIPISDPQSGEFKVYAIQRDSTGKLKVEYESVAEP